jgi:hypothetical protein
MQTEPDEMAPTKPAPVARGFSVPPNGNVVKLIAFASDDPDLQLTTGRYSVALYAWIDGEEPRAPDTSFTVEVNADAMRTINEGGIHVSLTQYELPPELP